MSDSIKFALALFSATFLLEQKNSKVINNNVILIRKITNTYQSKNYEIHI